MYTTPKSFLELIKRYISMLKEKRIMLETQRDNYDSGVIKLKETGENTAILEEELKVLSVELDKKKAVADE